MRIEQETHRFDFVPRDVFPGGLEVCDLSFEFIRIFFVPFFFISQFNDLIIPTLQGALKIIETVSFFLAVLASVPRQVNDIVLEALQGALEIIDTADFFFAFLSSVFKISFETIDLLIMILPGTLEIFQEPIGSAALIVAAISGMLELACEQTDPMITIPSDIVHDIGELADLAALMLAALYNTVEAMLE